MQSQSGASAQDTSALLPKRRVIWVNRFFHPDESATSIMLSDLVRSLAVKDGFEHHVVTSNANYASHEGSSPDIDQVAAHRVPAIGTNNSSLLLRLVNFALFYLGSFFLLARLCRRGDLVVALTDPPLIGTLVGWVARVKGAKSVHWVQDIFPETAARLGFLKEGGVLARILQNGRNRAWRRADVNVAIGGCMKSFIESHGAQGERVHVIQNWAADEVIRPVSEVDNSLRREWGYGAQDCVIGYSGNLGRAHDIGTMMSAMRMLASNEQRSPKFLFVGGGAKQGSVRKAKEDLPEGMVAFQPYQPMHLLSESLSVPDVHWITLEPALEGLIVPSKLYGALAVGRALVFVGDEEGEVARILREADCGASFAPGDSAALSEYLSLLTLDRELRLRLGRNGRAYLEQELIRSKRIEQWGGLLASLAAPVSSSASRPQGSG